MNRSLQTVLIVVLSCLTLCAASRADEAVRPMVRFNIGWSGNDQKVRHIRRLSRNRGWRSFVTTEVMPVIEWYEQAGYFPRIALWNPGGTIRGEPMQFDQFVDAQEGVPGVHPPMPWLVDDFVEAWRPLTSPDPDTGRARAEVIAYIGSPGSDMQFSWQADQHLQDDLLERTLKSLRLPLDAGMSIGFDAAAKYSEASQTHRLVQYLNSLGVKTYIEASPSRASPHWYDDDMFVLERTYQLRHGKNRSLRAKELYDLTDAYSGQVIRIIRSGDFEGDVQAQLDTIRQAVKQGHTPCFSPGVFMEQGMSLKQVLGLDP